MPIKGRINAQKVPHRVYNMIVGDKGYILIEDVAITITGILVHFDCEVLSKEEIEDEEKTEGGTSPDPSQYYVHIARIGEGFSDRDFELDFSHLKSDVVFDVHSAVRYDALLRDLANEYLVFRDPDFDFDLPTQDLPTEKKSLQDQLDDAIKKQDFPLAAKLRDEINGKKKE